MRIGLFVIAVLVGLASVCVGAESTDPSVLDVSSDSRAGQVNGKQKTQMELDR